MESAVTRLLCFVVFLGLVTKPKVLLSLSRCFTSEVQAQFIIPTLGVNLFSAGCLATGSPCRFCVQLRGPIPARFHVSPTRIEQKEKKEGWGGGSRSVAISPVHDASEKPLSERDTGYPWGVSLLLNSSRRIR